MPALPRIPWRQISFAPQARSVGGRRFQRPIMVGDLVEVEARLAYTGKTSMDISVEVRSGDMAVAHRVKAQLDTARAAQHSA